MTPDSYIGVSRDRCQFTSQSGVNVSQVRKLSVAIYKLLCIVALMIHFGVMTDKYFRFEVTTATQLNVPSEVEPPAISICFKYAGMLDVRGLNTARNLSLEAMNWRNLSNIWENQDDIQ